MIQTRKNEVIITTSDPREMLDHYTVNSVCRTWEDDYHDADTGEIITINRSEVIVEPGTLITKDTIAQIQFFMAEGSIKEVTVSNQRREAVQVGTGMALFTITAEIDTKKKKFLLYAANVSVAIDIVTDWIELHYKGTFVITSVKVSDKSIVLMDSVASEDMPEGAKMAYYKVHALISWLKPDGNRTTPMDGAYIVNTYSAERAQEVITSQVISDANDEAQRRGTEAPLGINAALEEVSIISMNRFIPKDFSNVYNDDTDSAGTD